ncbi:MAG: TetR/AcrR family transcriptional regulator [Solirubrobacteraceae bacterium]
MTGGPETFETLSPRAREVLVAARELLEEEGYQGLTMRRLGERLGIRGQSLYEHFADKRAIERALTVEILLDCGTRMDTVAAGAADPLMAMCDEHRAWARRHPHAYRLAWGGTLDMHDRQTEAAALRSGEALIAYTKGDRRYSRAIFAFIHGLILLELDERLLQPDSDLDEIWRFGIEAIRSAAEG